MFEIGFPELVLVCIVALVVLGPERLPEALRTLGLWLGRIRRSFLSVKGEIEREVGMDEVRRQLHNEAVMEDIKRLEREVRVDRPSPTQQISPTATPNSAAPAMTATPADNSPGDGTRA